MKPDIARITSLRVENFRALKQIELKDLTPLTVLLGPNGSGKSTFFDLFAFLSECFESGLRRAWERRGRAKELKSRGGHGPVVIEIKYKEGKNYPVVTYHLAVDEIKGSPIVMEEWLQWRRGSTGLPFKFLNYKEGKGEATSGAQPDAEDARLPIPLKSPDLLAVNALGQFADHPRVAALRDFITGWHVSQFSVDQTRGQPEAGPQEHLSRSGDNVANVIQYLQEHYPDHLQSIFALLRQRVPCIERILADPLPDGRLLLQIKDSPFEQPILARFASDGTLKMLAYLLLLHDPSLPTFIGIEEPENFLHPRLLPELAEECRASAERGQLLVTTHSPFFINSLHPEEVRILYRNEAGYTQTVRTSDIPGIPEFMGAGATLGHLWMEGRFGQGDPLVNEGGPILAKKGKK